MNDASGYGGTNNASTSPGTPEPVKYWTLSQCKTAYQDYLARKRDEINERIQSRRYRHGTQWTADQIKALNRRKQPVVTFDHCGPKINGIVGSLERLRQDPKAYPRTPQHQEGADLATAALRYATEEQMWKAKSALCYEDGAVDGIGCMEFELEPGDKTDGHPDNGQQDYDVAFYPVRDGFFYDPRSFDLDFADAAYMGRGKWVDENTLKKLDPDGVGGNGSYSTGDMAGSELTEDTDRDNKWFYSTAQRKMFRLIDIWYKVDDKWLWALFTGARIIKEGESHWFDEKNRSRCKFLAFSAGVDHDGDRYGFIRLFKGPQDEVNHRHSKALHELNSRRVILRKSQLAAGDVEAFRREMGKPDGVGLINDGITEPPIFDDSAKQANVMGQFEMLQYATAAIENFGPDAKAVGEDGVKAESGRALALRSQAGFAQLGPFFGSVKSFNLRCYRFVFCAIQKYWTGERWVRVTDNQGVQQLIQINGVQMGPAGPMLVNAIGSLDVDIIVDEGPDTVTMMQDTFDTLSQALPAVAGLISPNVATAALEVLVENSPMPEEAKKKFRDAAAQPAPPSPEMAKVEAEKARDQAKFDLEARKTAADIETKRVIAQQEIQLEREKADNEIELERTKAFAKIQLERELGQQKMVQQAADADQQRQLEREGFAHESQMQDEQAEHDRQIARDQADTKIETSSAVAANQMKIAKQKASQRPAASK